MGRGPGFRRDDKYAGMTKRAFSTKAAMPEHLKIQQMNQYD
jgi:hypothetical protein